MEPLTISADALSKSKTFRNADSSFSYVLSGDLKDAVETAILLNLPLLITGEPGTGKTTLAEKVASDLSDMSNGAFRNKPYKFHTKSTSVFTDLFYTYDAITHFYDANIKKETGIGLSKYITLNALGSAISASLSPDEKKRIPASNVPPENEPKNSVVLIDEIDKATRDFPNDLLNELEHLQFNIKEAGFNEFSKAADSTILIILTSNGEKEFPEAFLRRCIFFHIDFPDDSMLKNILERHALGRELAPKLETILARFREIRSICRNKKPATAELISWCRLIAENKIDPSDKDALASTLLVLVKDRNDQKLVRQSWASQNGQ